MTRQEALRVLSAALPDLRERFSVSGLGVFGSTALDEAGPASDVDVLVWFEGKAHFRACMGQPFALEEFLGAKVDLVSSRTLKPRLRKEVEQDLVLVS